MDHRALDWSVTPPEPASRRGRPGGVGPVTSAVFVLLILAVVVLAAVLT